MQKIRVGFGFDVHKLIIGEPFWLGGIKINHYKGAFGHSDADVLIHVICDALLGAANLRDIGHHFPDVSDEFKGIDSKILLERVMLLIRKKGWDICNIDSTICLQQPKVNPYVDEMKKCLARVMNLEPTEISIKATTTEKLGFVGEERGVSAYATVLIQEQ